jgi:hypothetical protein
MSHVEINILGILRPKPGKMNRVSQSLYLFSSLLTTRFES